MRIARPLIRAMHTGSASWSLVLRVSSSITLTMHFVAALAVTVRRREIMCPTSPKISPSWRRPITKPNLVSIDASPECIKQNLLTGVVNRVYNLTRIVCAVRYLAKYWFVHLNLLDCTIGKQDVWINFTQPRCPNHDSNNTSLYGDTILGWRVYEHFR